MKSDFDWKQVREDYRSDQAPDSVRQALFAEFPETKPRRNWTPVWALAFGFCVIIALLAGIRFSKQPQGPKPTLGSQTVALAPVVQPPVVQPQIVPAPVMQAPAVASVQELRQQIRQTRVLPKRSQLLAARTQPIPRLEPRQEVATEFIAFPGSEALPVPTETSLIRARVPLGTAQQFGFRVRSQEDGFVRADFVIGQDGLARAVRLVQ